MKYRPYWQRILFLAVVLNLIFLLSSSSIFFASETEETPPEDLPEIAWIDTEIAEIPTDSPQLPTVETFPEIVLPPLEIPHTEFEPLPELKVEPQELPQPVEVETPPVEEVEEKAEEKPEDKLKAIAKIYPKDIIPQFVQSGVIRGNLTLAEDKIVLAVTITVEGKVRNVEIISGGDKGLIDIVAKTAAGSWRFEPYLDADGNPQELKTQIEFTPEDFQM